MRELSPGEVPAGSEDWVLVDEVVTWDGAPFA
jgi:hypothetical protein